MVGSPFHVAATTRGFPFGRSRSARTGDPHGSVFLRIGARSPESAPRAASPPTIPFMGPFSGVPLARAARSPRSLDQPPPPAIDVDGRGERLAHDRRRDPHRGGDVAGDRAPPRRPPLRGPGRRADRARQDQAIRLVRSVSSRPVVSRSSAGEDPSRHREHPSGTEPCVVVHDLDIGRT